jgi:hypothetical protein
MLYFIMVEGSIMSVLGTDKEGMTRRSAGALMRDKDLCFDTLLFEFNSDFLRCVEFDGCVDGIFYPQPDYGTAS